MSKTKKKPSPGRGRPTDESKSEAIMKAAENLFMKNGMARVTMDDIAAAAGVSKLTVYNRHGTKEDLFQTMIRNKCQSHMSDEMMDGLDGSNPRADLEKIGRGFVDVIYSSEGISVHRTVMSEARHDKKIASLFYESGPLRVFNSFESYLARLEKVSALKFPDKHRAAELFFCLFQGHMFMNISLGLKKAPSGKDLDQFISDNVSAFLKIFQAS